MVSPSNNREFELLTVPEAAARMHVSRSLVYQLVEQGRLPVYRVGIGRGAIRVMKDDLLRFVESCRDSSGGAAIRPPRRQEKLRHLKV